MSELRSKPKIDYYKVLQVDPTAETEVIEASYRALSKKYHPDLNSAPEAAERMAQINMAFDVLRDSLKRKDYDKLWGLSRSAAPNASAPSVQRSETRTTSTGVHSSNSAGGSPKTSTSSGYSDRAVPTNKPYSKPPVNSNGRSGTHSRPDSYASDSKANKSSSSSSPKISQKIPKVPPHNPSLNLDKHGSKLGKVAVVLVVITITMLVGYFLAKTVLDNPGGATSIIQGLPQAAQQGGTENGINSNRTQSTTPFGSSSTAVAGPLTKELLAGYLNNPELYEGRVIDLVLQGGDTLQLQLQLGRAGKIVNGPDNSPSVAGSDELDLMRQSELTAYTLTYSLFGRFAELKTLSLRLSDPGDGKKVIYRAMIPRSFAYSFSLWHGSMDPKTLSPKDFIEAATEDRLLQHLGGPTEDATRSRLNQPDKNNLKAELAHWNLDPNTLDVSLTSNEALIGYYASRPQEEKDADYARIFYALYTRFPNLDRIQVQNSTPGTASNFSRASNRTLFNKITPTSWAQSTFDARARELLDSLPTALNSPSLNQPSGEAQVNPGGNGVNTLVKTWQIVNPGTYTRLSSVGTFGPVRGFTLILVKIPLKNLTGESQWPIPNSLFSLIDATGRVFRPDPLISTFYTLDVEHKIPLGPVDNTKDVELKVIFEVPTNVSGVRLLFQDHEVKASLPITQQ